MEILRTGPVKTGLVIGGGPAGLMAASEMARAGLSVTLVERMPTVGRKFLMAGKSGLNLTMDEPPEVLLSRYHCGPAIADAVRAFGPPEVQAWARGLGQEVFTGSSGRVFPATMKASPLLRAWLADLAAQGVVLHTRWRWQGWDRASALFDTPDGAQRLACDVTVLALGGASWARLGSDGAWAGVFGAAGIETVPFMASNAGLNIPWSPHMARHFGQPVKGTAIHAGSEVHRGEYVISARGLEGGGIYGLSPAVRAGQPLVIDLMPDWSAEKIAERLSRPRGKATTTTWLRKALRLDDARLGLLLEFGMPLPEAAALHDLIKALPLRHDGLRPLDEAISTVGGVPETALDAQLMLRERPGVFVAGEMIDWDAPTGGYLITACLATGRHAGRAAARWARAGA